MEEKWNRGLRKVGGAAMEEVRCKHFGKQQLKLLVEIGRRFKMNSLLDQIVELYFLGGNLQEILKAIKEQS